MHLKPPRLVAFFAARKKEIKTKNAKVVSAQLHKTHFCETVVSFVTYLLVRQHIISSDQTAPRNKEFPHAIICLLKIFYEVFFSFFFFSISPSLFLAGFRFYHNEANGQFPIDVNRIGSAS